MFRKHKQDLRQRAVGILCGFQGFLTQNPAVFIEIDDSFDFSDTPQADSCEEAQGGYTNI